MQGSILSNFPLDISEYAEGEKNTQEWRLNCVFFFAYDEQLQNLNKFRVRYQNVNSNEINRV